MVFSLTEIDPDKLSSDKNMNQNYSIIVIIIKHEDSL